MFNPDQLSWPESGLLPAIAQDADNGHVLTLAWQNREALQKTLETGLVHYWSRSRQVLWQKGESSGNTQRLVDIRTDCDQDTILMLVEPAGPACHTNRPSCFYLSIQEDDLVEQPDNPWPRPDILKQLELVIKERRDASASKSYVKSLLDDPSNAAGKVTEEAEELIEAVVNESEGRVAAEAADLIFHALVLSAGRGVDWTQIASVLEQRFGTSGHDEKAARGANHVVGKNQTSQSDSSSN